MNELLDYRGVNSVAEAFFSSLQRELLDQQRCDTRNQLAQAIFEWIETWYNQRRRQGLWTVFSPSCAVTGLVKCHPALAVFCHRDIRFTASVRLTS
jgi:hypothetical protein